MDISVELLQRAMLEILWVAGPVLVVTLIIGVLISFLQSITQIQEMTLTFVPKIIAVGVMMALFGHVMLAHLSDFAIETIQMAVGLM